MHVSRAFENRSWRNPRKRPSSSRSVNSAEHSRSPVRRRSANPRCWSLQACTQEAWTWESVRCACPSLPPRSRRFGAARRESAKRCNRQAAWTCLAPAARRRTIRSRSDGIRRASLACSTALQPRPRGFRSRVRGRGASMFRRRQGGRTPLVPGS